MKTYELTYIISPDVTSEEVESKAKEIESIISSKEGTIIRQSTPTARALSYPIEKRASGFFGVLEFQLEPEQLLELKEILSKDGKIVRHMLLVKEPVRIRKERRSRVKSDVQEVPSMGSEVKAEIKTETEAEEIEEEKDEKPARNAAHSAAGGEKVELKDIEQKLDELLGE